MIQHILMYMSIHPDRTTLPGKSHTKIYTVGSRYTLLGIVYNVVPHGMFGVRTRSSHGTRSKSITCEIKAAGVGGGEIIEPSCLKIQTIYRGKYIEVLANALSMTKSKLLLNLDIVHSFMEY